LLSQLDAKGKALAIEQERLNKSAQRQIRIIDCCQRSNNEKLKETLSNALNSFEGKGPEQKRKSIRIHGNKLLFNSGSWAVGSEGKKQW
jgi:chemotaxis protein MotB